jgi:hypothetical protein
MYSDFYDEKDDSDANLGQRSVSLVSELLGSWMWWDQMCQIITPRLTQCATTTLLFHTHSRPALQQERKKTGGTGK